MKNSVLFLFVVSLSLLLVNCGPTKQDAFEYHQKIVNEEHKIIRHLSEIGEVFPTFDADSIELVLNAALSQTNNSVKILEDMDDLGDESKLKENCLEFFGVIVGLIENEYQQKLEIYKLPKEEYDSLKLLKYKELNITIDEKYFPAFDKYAKAEEDFADEWDFELTPADL